MRSALLDRIEGPIQLSPSPARYAHMLARCILLLLLYCFGCHRPDLDRQISVRAEVLQTFDAFCLGFPQVLIHEDDADKVRELTRGSGRAYVAIGLPPALNQRMLKLWLTVQPTRQTIHCTSLAPHPPVLQIVDATIR